MWNICLFHTANPGGGRALGQRPLQVRQQDRRPVCYHFN